MGAAADYWQQDWEEQSKTKFEFFLVVSNALDLSAVISRLLSCVEQTLESVNIQLFLQLAQLVRK